MASQRVEPGKLALAAKTGMWSVSHVQSHVTLAVVIQVHGHGDPGHTGLGRALQLVIAKGKGIGKALLEKNRDRLAIN